MKTPPSTDPEELEAEREIAEERDAKYGGRDRWFLTGASLLCGALAFTHGPLTILLVVLAILLGVWAIVNWRSWLALSPEARAAKLATPTRPVTVARIHRRATPAAADARRLADVIGLMTFPLACVLFVCSTEKGMSAPRILMAVLLIGLGAAFYFSPDPPDEGDRKTSHPDHPPDHSPEAVGRLHVGTMAINLSIVLALPISFLAYLLSLVWLHRTIAKHEVIILVVGIPLAVAAFSWGAKIRLERHKAEMGRKVAKIYAWTVLALWGASVFILAILIVHLFQ